MTSVKKRSKQTQATNKLVIPMYDSFNVAHLAQLFSGEASVALDLFEMGVIWGYFSPFIHVCLRDIPHTLGCCDLKGMAVPGS